jgi:hypothetical protein
VARRWIALFFLAILNEISNQLNKEIDANVVENKGFFLALPKF